MKNFVLISMVVVSLLLPMAGAVALDFKGSGTKLHAVAGEAGLIGSGDLEDVTGAVVSTALVLVGTIFFVLTIYAGIRLMTAQGNSEAVEKAKKTLIAAVIGLIITMSAYAITAFVTGRLGVI